MKRNYCQLNRKKHEKLWAGQKKHKYLLRRECRIRRKSSKIELGKK